MAAAWIRVLVGNEPWVSDAPPLPQDVLLLLHAAPPQPVAPSMILRPAGPDVAPSAIAPAARKAGAMRPGAQRPG